MINFPNKIKGHEANDSYSYKNFDFSGLVYSHSSYSILGHDGFKLSDYVCPEIYSGNELLYYPELAKALREAIKEYPKISRKYEVDKEVKGIEFFNYLCQRFVEVVNLFENEVAQAKNEVNNLINQYGYNRQLPIINELITEWNYPSEIVINGVKWQLGEHNADDKLLTHINIKRLLNIQWGEFDLVRLETARIGTPFVGIRLGKTWRHKGTLYWYNLDTMQRVKKSEIEEFQKA